jgi:hypothetical protein
MRGYLEPCGACKFLMKNVTETLGITIEYEAGGQLWIISGGKVYGPW